MGQPGVGDELRRLRSSFWIPEKVQPMQRPQETCGETEAVWLIQAKQTGKYRRGKEARAAGQTRSSECSPHLRWDRNLCKVKEGTALCFTVRTLLPDTVTGRGAGDTEEPQRLAHTTVAAVAARLLV